MCKTHSVALITCQCCNGDASRAGASSSLDSVLAFILLGINVSHRSALCYVVLLTSSPNIPIRKYCYTCSYYLFLYFIFLYLLLLFIIFIKVQPIPYFKPLPMLYGIQHREKFNVLSLAEKLCLVVLYP